MYADSSPSLSGYEFGFINQIIAFPCAITMYADSSPSLSGYEFGLSTRS